jgi:hypothetical protein
MTYTRLTTLPALMLLVLFCARLFAQSAKLVSMTAPNGRLYTTICVAERCEIQEAAYAVVSLIRNMSMTGNKSARPFAKPKGRSIQYVPWHSGEKKRSRAFYAQT